MTDYGSPVFGAWRKAARPEWEAYTRHAFVEAMKDGTLPRAAFLHYLVQDYVFLIHFSRAWALGVVKSGSRLEMTTCAATVDALVNHEMRLHVEICAREGISEDDLYDAREATPNLAYTRYVMDAGVSGDFLDLMAGLAPCVFGYGEIGARLAKEAVPDGPYAEWIGTYAGEEYQGLCANVGAMLEAAISDRLGPKAHRLPRWTALCERFRTATRLEVDFWRMGLDGTAPEGAAR